MPSTVLGTEYTRMTNINGPGQVWSLTLIIPALWEAKAGGSPEVKSSRPAWATQQDPIFKKKKRKRKRKISWVWWCAPIVLAICYLGVYDGTIA